MAWKRRHPRLAVAGLVVLLALLGWAGYRGAWYFWARSHLQAAHQALGRYDWKEAHAHLNECLRVWPESPAVHLLAARAARRLELLDEAAAHLDACERLPGCDPQAARVERALLRVHRGNLAGAEEYLRACVTQDDPDAVEILDILAAALMLDDRAAEAQQCLDELLRRQPDHFHALVRRGWAARTLSRNRFAEAVQYYERALALRPDADTVRLGLADIQAALGRFEEARAHFELLRGRQPRNPSVLFGLARCLAGTGHKEQAVELLDQLLANYPGDWKVLGERGWLAVELDRPAEAEGYLRRAAALAPPDLPLLTRLADCLRLLGKPDEARQYRERAALLKADLRRADYLRDLVRTKKPDDPAPRHELACTLLRLGNKEEALHWFRTALDKDPSYRPAHESLAALYEKAGAWEQAARHRQFLQGPVGAGSGTSRR